jgi:hypothetical protein
VTVVALEPANPRIGRTWPPYAREVLAGPRNVYLYTGKDAWQRARARRERHGPGSALLLPPDSDANAFRWPAVPGGILIVASAIPRTLALELARVIVSDGTPMVFVIGERDGFSVASRSWREDKAA